MKKLPSHASRFLLGLGLLVGSHAAFAGDLTWSGKYRAEGVFLKNPTLNNGENLENSYFIHHLVLEPKIIPTDGITIRSRFDIFNNALGNNQAGQVFGNYTGAPGNASGSASVPSSVLSRQQQDGTILVTELYMTWITNEFGALIVGRVPFHFGTGMYFNDGRGPFDHAISTKDLVAYKIIAGNFTFIPAYGKVRESSLLAEDDINDYIITAEYDNKDTDLTMGFLFDSRQAPVDGNSPSRGNDFLASEFGPTAIITDGYSAYNMNIFLKKKIGALSIASEVGFLTGFSGVKVPNAGGGFDRVELSGFGVLGELQYKMGPWDLGLKAGLASGDDPDTTTRFEGYGFSPNYDIAMMLFNYPLGKYDVLRSKLFGTRASTQNSDTSALSGLDTEVISNTVYFAPQFKYNVTETWELNLNLAYAMLQKAPLATSTGTVGSSLGIETDFGFTYRPTERIMWQTLGGLFFPGSAWQGTPSSGYKSELAYGLTMKAAISF